MIKHRKGIKGISADTMDAVAYNLLGCEVNDSFKGVKSTRKRESRHKTPTLLDKSH